MELGGKVVAGVQVVFKGQGHIGLRQRSNSAVSNTAPSSVRDLIVLAVDGNSGGIAAVLGVVYTHSARLNLVVVEIGVIGGGGEHYCVSPAAGAAGGNEVIPTAGQVAQQNIVLNEACRSLLVCKARGSVAGIVGVPIFIRSSILLATVAAGHIDIAVGGIGGGSKRVVLRAVAGRTGVQDDGGGSGGIGLAVGAGDLGLIVDDQGAADGFFPGLRTGHIGRAVPVSVNAGDISAGNADGNALLIGQFRIGYCRHDRHDPCVGVRAVGPCQIGIVGQIQGFLNIGFLLGIGHSDFRSRRVLTAGA